MSDDDFQERKKKIASNRGRGGGSRGKRGPTKAPAVTRFLLYHQIIKKILEFLKEHPTDTHTIESLEDEIGLQNLAENEEVIENLQSNPSIEYGSGLYRFKVFKSAFSFN